MEKEKYMSAALELAREAAEHGEVPVGCVITDKKARIRAALSSPRTPAYTCL